MLALLVARNEPGAPGLGSPRAASLRAMSAMLPLPPPTARAFAPAYPKSSDRSPSCTV